MRYLIYLIITLTAYSDLTFAQWASLNGPEAGSIRHLFETSDGILYAANSENLFVKVAPEAKWRLEETPFNHTPIQCFVESPDGDIYVGLANSQSSLFRKATGSTQWQSLSLGTNHDIRTMIFSQSGKLVLEFGNSVYLSSDRGMTGERIILGDDLNILTLQVHPSGSIFAGTTQGVYRSDNEGQSWATIQTGITPDIYAVLLDISMAGAIAVADLENNIYFADSLSSGFVKLSNDSIQDELSNLLFDQENQLYASTSKGSLYQYQSLTDEWKEIFHTPTGSHTIYDMLLDQNEAFIVAARGEGIWSGPENNFHLINEGLAAAEVISMTSQDDELLVSTITTLFSWSSENEVWEERLVDGQYFFSQDIVPLNSDQLIAATSSGVSLVNLSDSDVTSENLGLDHRINFVQSSVGGKLFAGTFNEGFYVTTDTGHTWIDISTEEMRNSTLTSMGLIGEDTLFAGTNRGIFSSTDGGISWRWSIENVPSVRQILVGRDQTIFAAAYPGIIRSKNLGLSWQSFPVSQDRPVYQLLETTEGILYAAMERDGIYHSSDQGQTWQQASNDLQGMTVNCLTVNEKGDIFAGTSSRGVYQLHSSTKAINLKPSIGIKVYPNPTNSIIAFELPAKIGNRANITVFSMHGSKMIEKEVALNNLRKLEMDISQIPAGSYFIVFESGQSSYTHKILVFE